MNFRIKFTEQLVSADSIGQLVETINRHTDSIPYIIETDEGKIVAKWTKHDGLILYETSVTSGSVGDKDGK